MPETQEVEDAFAAESVDYDDAPGETPAPKPKTTKAKKADEPEDKRKIVMESIEDMDIVPIHWLWKQRIPMGMLTLIAGREGIGKSTLTTEIAAYVTKGESQGDYFGTPLRVGIVAGEDDFPSVIKPRLMAAKADISMISKVNIVDPENPYSMVEFPRDLQRLEDACEGQNFGMVILDPLMSRISGKIDTHKDADVRRALEPLRDFAERANIAIVGLIHVNKSSTKTDFSNMIMGSRAFTAVPRSVLAVMQDPDDEERVMVGLGKSNHASKSKTKTYAYTIESVMLTAKSGDHVETSRIKWCENPTRSVDEALQSSMSSEVDLGEAAGWLSDLLDGNNGQMERKSVIKLARAEGFSESTVDRARRKLKIVTTRSGFPQTSVWSLPGFGDAEDKPAPVPPPSTKLGAELLLEIEEMI